MSWTEPPRPLELDARPTLRTFNRTYDNYKFQNNSPFHVLIRFDSDSTNMGDPDFIVDPWTTQITSVDGGADEVLYQAASRAGGSDLFIASNPSEAAPLFGFFATDQRVRMQSTAFARTGLLEALQGAALSSLESIDQPVGALVYRSRSEADTFDRVSITNTGVLSIGDGTAEPVAIGRLVGLDDLAGYLPLSGGSMTGNLNMDGNPISLVGGPNASHQAVPASYVDDSDAAALSQAQSYTDARVQTLAGDTYAEAKPPQGWPSGLVAMTTTTTRWFAAGMLLHNSGGGRTPARFTQTLITSGAGEMWFRNAVDGLTWGAWQRALMAGGDAMTGNLNMGGNTISSLPDPAGVGQVSPKRYVDNGDAAALSQAQSYADSGDSTRVAKSGDTMSGNLNMDGHYISLVGGPNASHQAVPASYVDDSDAAALSQAQSYADSGDSSTLSSAHSYTDARTGVGVARLAITAAFTESISVTVDTHGTNLVSVEGQVQNTSGGTVAPGGVIGQIPAGKHPIRRHVYACPLATTAAWSGTVAPISVNTNGQIVTERAITAGYYIGLSNIHYRIA